MAGYWMVHSVDNVADPDEAWEVMIRAHSCDCAARTPPDEDRRDGHWESCTAAWWVREDQKVSAGYTLRKPSGSPWSPRHVVWEIPLREEDAKMREGSGSPVGHKFGPWAATPLGPGSFRPVEHEIPHGRMTLDQLRSIEYDVDQDSAWRDKGWQAVAAFYHTFPPNERPVPVAVRTVRHVKGAAWTPTGEVTGWVFYGWVNG